MKKGTSLVLKLVNQFLTICFILLTGCSYYVDKTNDGGGDQSQGVTEAEKLNLSYKIVNEKVFAPRCVSCHGNAGGINLSSYESVIANLGAVERTALRTKTMPKGESLSQQESQLLEAWLQAGAPLDPSSGPGHSSPGDSNPAPSPAPPVDPPPPSEDPDQMPEPPVATNKLTYAFVNREVFIPKCIGCHGSAGGVSLESYQSIKSGLSAIKRVTLVDKTMPKNDSLTPRQLSILKKWIALGAPKGGKPKPGPAPNPSEPQPPVDEEPGSGSGDEETDPPPNVPSDPLVPTFSSIKSHILVPKCLNCHSPGGQAARIPMSTLKELLESPLELVIPGNPEESSVVIVIEKQDSKRMPPPESGDPLSSQEIQIIKEWIQNGAKE